MVLPSRAPPAPGRGCPGRAVSHARHQRHRGAAGGLSRAGPWPGSHAPLHTHCCFHTRPACPDTLPPTLTRCFLQGDSPSVCTCMCALPCVCAQVCVPSPVCEHRCAHAHTPLPCECVTLPARAHKHSSSPVHTHACQHVFPLCACVHALPRHTWAQVHAFLLCACVPGEDAHVCVCARAHSSPMCTHMHVHTLLWCV